MHIVLDTNVLISGIVYPKSIPSKILSKWKSNAIKITLSEYIIDEFKRVLPKLKKNQLTKEEINTLSEILMYLANMVEPMKINEPDLRDKKDQEILGTFLKANADYLITGDKDLLVLSNKYPIMTAREFWETFG